MTLEAVLLLILAVFFMLAFTKPAGTFLDSSPKLGARLEYQMATGRGFSPTKEHTPLKWIKPSGAEPTGSFQ